MKNTEEEIEAQAKEKAESLMPSDPTLAEDEPKKK